MPPTGSAPSSAPGEYPLTSSKRLRGDGGILHRHVELEERLLGWGPARRAAQHLGPVEETFRPGCAPRFTALGLPWPEGA